MIGVATFNILAESLANNEFLSEGGDSVSISWESRGPKICEIIKKILEKCDIIATQENDNFNYIMSMLPKKNSGVYYQKSNLGIYYNSEKVELLETHYLDGKCLRCDFKYKDKILNVFACHLKSGENQNSELIRISQLKIILDSCLELENPIILMDSNNSVLYEMEYPYENRLSTLIDKYGFKNTVKEQKGNECFKMRHGFGNQPSKFFNFMFDAIDKILVRKDTNFVLNHENYGFKKYNIDNYDYLLNIRLNERELFKKECEKNIRSTSTLDCFTEDSPFRDLYPNKQAPSDHPPVSCFLIL